MLGSEVFFEVLGSERVKQNMYASLSNMLILYVTTAHSMR